MKSISVPSIVIKGLQYTNKTGLHLTRQRKRKRKSILQFQYTNEVELEQDSRFTVSTTEENDFAVSTTIGTRFSDFGVEDELEKDNN